MRVNRFAAMINAATAAEIASISKGDLLILLEGLQPMDGTPEVVAALSRIVNYGTRLDRAGRVWRVGGSDQVP